MYCACHTKRLSTCYRTPLNVTKCHACHAKRSNNTSETSKNDPSCKTSHRHGHTGIARTVADGCERLRTVALANATSSEHTLNPQTPRVKREPLLRIREKDASFCPIEMKKKFVFYCGENSIFPKNAQIWTSKLVTFPATQIVTSLW